MHIFRSSFATSEPATSKKLPWQGFITHLLRLLQVIFLPCISLEESDSFGERGKNPHTIPQFPIFCWRSRGVMERVLMACCLRDEKAPALGPSHISKIMIRNSSPCSAPCSTVNSFWGIPATPILPWEAGEIPYMYSHCSRETALLYSCL